ncbi:MAG: VWA domain-containing protein [Ignavibacteriales bacterium]|nr:VWA domain-containing protein [Ignavibacteriales bacterium]
MSLSFQVSLFLVVLFAAAAVALSVYIYRHTVPVVSRLQRNVLIVLRSLAFTLTLVAMFEPLLTLTSSTEERPAVAVLVDNSLSMSHADRTVKRDSAVTSLLSGSSFASLESNASLQLLKFSYAASPLSRDSLRMDGGSTNISSAIQSAVKETPAALQSIILITDGNYNAGPNPLYDAERSRIPIFTVGVGDTAEQNDLSVSKLITNSIGYVDASIPVDAVITSSGIPATTVTVSLLEEGKKVDEKTVTLSSAESGIAETPVQFSYTPRNDGVKKLTVRIPALDNESTAKNNSRSALVKILKSKMNIVVIAGAPGPDVSAVMQSLNNDKNISPALFVQLPSGELKTTSDAPSLNQSLSTADCAVLIGFPAPQSTSHVMQTVASAVRSRQLSLLFIAGRLIDLQKLKELEPLLPFTITGNRADEQTILAHLIPQHKYHALAQVDAERFPSFAWEKLPPVYAALQSFSAKPEAQTLLGVKIQGVTLQNPLLVTRSIANTKSLAILGYGIHRWKLLAGAGDETRDVFDAWFSALVRWLATHDQDSRLKVEPSKALYSQGEPVEFTGEVYSENFQPVDNTDLQLSIRTLNGEHVATVAMRSIGSGRYEGSTTGMNEGEYIYRASSLIDGDTLATTSGRFSVGEQSIEFAETKMNKSLLQQIASKSGGMYADAAQFDSLMQKILSRPEMKQREKIHTSEFELWNLPAYLSAIILLFATEWFLRKRWGML